jgi:hypothetical protein
MAVPRSAYTRRLQGLVAHGLPKGSVARDAAFDRDA